MSKAFKIYLTVLLSSVSINFSISPAEAANNNTLWTAPQAQSQSVRQEKLTYTPTLAYIPTYTGKNCINTESLHYTGLPTGECYNLKFLMREDPATVLAWYQSALRGVGWTIDTSAATATSISASQPSGVNCYIYARPSQQPGFACEVVLRYSVRPNGSS